MGLFDSLVSAAGQAAMDALQNKTGAADGAGGLDVMGLATPQEMDGQTLIVK